MRLIDADAWIEELNQIISDEENPKGAKEWAVGMIAAITVRPTAYDVDKVMEQVREFHGLCNKCLNNKNSIATCAMFCDIGKELAIIKSSGIE